MLLPLAAAAMLALQAATGDSALRVVLRRRGFRTAAEIEAESHALSALLEREEGRAPAPSPTRRTGPDAAPI
ncbi:MAG: hypothetical protein HZY79_07760 [Rhodoblastus sp.]|nr:MAG: hypothetical protein HZY79_07760 [Rhodoblastus sp.]